MRHEASERAETYLRLLAEVALRARTARPGPGFAEAADPGAAGDPGAVTREAAERVTRAADILIDADLLDDGQAAEILLMLGTALRLRGVDWRVSPNRARRLIGITSPGGGTGPGAGAGTAVPPWRVIPAPGSRPAGSRVMALIVTADRIIAPAMLRFAQPGAADRAVPSFADLTATDDLGTGYMLSFTDGSWAGGIWTGTLMLRPTPPDGASLLTIASPAGPVLRVPLAPSAAAEPAGSGEPAGDAAGAEGGTMAFRNVTDVPDSPGERLLTRRAEALLAALTAGGAVGAAAPAATATPARRAERAELIKALEAAGALSPISQVPGQLDSLGEWASAARVPGSARQPLPARWEPVLAYYARRRHPPLAPGAPAAGLGAIGAILPPVDGARLAVAGVHATSEGTLLHVVARGLRTMSRPSPANPAGRPPAAAQDTGLSWWVRDDSGSWHLGVVHAWHPANEDTVLRLALLPPLRPGLPGTSSALTIEVTGTWQRLTASVRVSW